MRAMRDSQKELQVVKVASHLGCRAGSFTARTQIEFGLTQWHLHPSQI